MKNRLPKSPRFFSKFSRVHDPSDAAENMIVRHGTGRPAASRKKPAAQSAVPRKKGMRSNMRSSMSSDGDDSASDERGGYSDDSEPELEAGCMGVKDPRELKRDRTSARERIQTAVLMLSLLGFGACLPYLLLAALELRSPAANVAGLGTGTAPGALNSIAAAHTNAELAGNVSLQSAAALKAPLPEFVEGPWGSTSDKAKVAIKAMVADKTLTLHPVWLEEELDAAELVFASGEGTCHDTCRKGGEEWMCTPEWFEFLNQCRVLRASFPAAGDCLTHLYGRDLPAFAKNLGVLRGGHVMINSRFAQYQTGCDAVGDHSVRLCACRKRVIKNEDKDMNARVSKIVIRQLRELDLRVKAGDDAGSKGVHGHLNEFWAG